MKSIPSLAEVRNDPFPLFARLRAESPVVFSEAEGAWLVSRYDDAVNVLRSSTAYSNRQNGLERVLVGSGSSRHVESRRSVQPAFSASSLELLEPIVRDVSANIVTNALAERGIEAIRSLAMPVPGAVFSQLLGVPNVESKRLIGWAAGITTFALGDLSSRRQSLAHEARRFIRKMYRSVAEPSFRDYVDAKEFIETHFHDATQRRDGSTLTQSLVNKHLDGGLTWNELISIGLEFAFAATETTSSLIGSSIRVLAEDQELQDQLRSDAALIEPFVEEVLRFTSPLSYLKRFTEVDCELGGCLIPARSRIRVLIASANRDDEVFPSSESFIANRTPNPHIAFGSGPHTCPGSRLARMEAQVLLEELLKQSHRFTRAEPNSLLKYRGYSGSRGLASLPLVVD